MIKVNNQQVIRPIINRYRFPRIRKIKPFQRIPLRMYLGGRVLGVIQLKRETTIEAYNEAYKRVEKYYDLEGLYKRVFYDGEKIEDVEDEYLSKNGDPITTVLMLSYAIQDRVNAFAIDLVTKLPRKRDGHLTAIRKNAKLLLRTSYARCGNAESILMNALKNYEILWTIRQYQLNIMRGRTIRRDIRRGRPR